MRETLLIACFIGCRVCLVKCNRLLYALFFCSSFCSLLTCIHQEKRVSASGMSLCDMNLKRGYLCYTTLMSAFAFIRLTILVCGNLKYRLVWQSLFSCERRQLYGDKLAQCWNWQPIHQNGHRFLYEQRLLLGFNWIWWNVKVGLHNNLAFFVWVPETARLQSTQATVYVHRYSDDYISQI